MVHTDQKCPRFLAEQRVMGEEQKKWISKLLGYDFEIKYKPRNKNKATDALSRILQLAALSIVQFYEWEDNVEEVNKDEQLRRKIQDLMADSNAHPGYKLNKGRL